MKINTETKCGDSCDDVMYSTVKIKKQCSNSTKNSYRLLITLSSFLICLSEYISITCCTGICEYICGIQ